MGVSQEAIECVPQRPSRAYELLTGSVISTACGDGVLGIGLLVCSVCVCCGWCKLQWQATVANDELCEIKTQLRQERDMCKNWRKQSDQQDRDLQLEISRRRAESKKHIQELNGMESELVSERQHSDDWRRYCEQQARDLQRDLQRETAQRRRYEQTIYSASPTPYQVQIDDLTCQLATQKELHIAAVAAHDKETRQLTMHLQEMKQRCEEWRTRSQEQALQLQQATLQKEEAAAARCRQDAKLKELKLECSAAQDDASHWRKHAQNQETSANRLREQVAELKKAARRRPGGGGALNFEQLASQVAENECRPLDNMSPESRQSFKKKLLVKWHPDKQPSPENVALATCVMQALQNRPEWSP